MPYWMQHIARQQVPDSVRWVCGNHHVRRMLGNMAVGILGESFTSLGQIYCFTTAHKGPFIFNEIRGAGGIWGGLPKKKPALKGGPSKKSKGKEGVT